MRLINIHCVQDPDFNISDLEYLIHLFPFPPKFIRFMKSVMIYVMTVFLQVLNTESEPSSHIQEDCNSEYVTAVHSHVEIQYNLVSGVLCNIQKRGKNILIIGIRKMCRIIKEVNALIRKVLSESVMKFIY